MLTAQHAAAAAQPAGDWCVLADGCSLLHEVLQQLLLP